MKWFNDLKIAKKLGFLILLSSFFIATTGLLAYHYLSQSNEILKDMYHEKLISIELLTENRNHQRALQASLLELMLTKDENENKRLLNSIQERTKQFNDNMQTLETKKMDDYQKRMMQEIRGLMQEYEKNNKDVIALALQNKNEDAYALYVGKVRTTGDQASVKIKELALYTDKIAEVAQDQNEKKEETVAIWLISLNLVSLLLIIGLGWTITRSIANPLAIVAGIAKDIAGGDLKEKDLVTDTADEVGQLAKAVQEMLKNLRSLIQKVAESSQQVATSSEELTTSSEQSAEATHLIATSIVDVAAGATEQLTTTHETSAVVEQISLRLRQISANANEVATQTTVAAEKAKEGGNTVEKAVNQMVLIENTINHSSRVVAKLGDRSKEIGQIVGTISGIASQTNLLALNAAIEAARAGEQGKGFAVVADEVRKLAEQSQEAAKRVAALIGEIQGDTEKAVMAMNDGTREVKTGADVVNRAGESFQHIAALVSSGATQTKNMSATLQEITTGSLQIVEAIKRIEIQSRKSAEETQSVSAATEQQLASMEEIASSSQALAKLAQDLLIEVAKFRL
ncbi:HAMP domain-containing protein [Heliobacterium gestii]|uniref:HAMP domain-containing protein n=1 Tax=Heliomicrobium gestii TaxID=2699 RepID=A0A845LFC3_HELGE|nr:methyl-accepting chemotaxis protein [Heliomicrobium gestii]MBM7867711.1 methyl-accepting chemotaxis protein [Heliomicrobium gestii]MZP44104.1 HAMP domain-containing protein [Heliomicrobium gestii]